MKFLILLTMLVLPFLAHAQCVVALKTNKRAGLHGLNLLKERHVHKMIKIMESKGYEVKMASDGSEDYILEVKAIEHLRCGYSDSRETFMERVHWRAEYTVGFKVAQGNEVFRKKSSYQRLFFAFPAVAAKRALMRAVRDIPVCE